MELGTLTKISPLVARPFVAFSEEDEEVEEKDKDVDADDFGDDDDEEKLDDGFVIEGDEVSDE